MGFFAKKQPHSPAIFCLLIEINMFKEKNRQTTTNINLATKIIVSFTATRAGVMQGGGEFA